MESEGGPAALAAQVEALDAADAAAARQGTPPLWYWLLMGAVFGAAVFVFSVDWGLAIACLGPAVLLAARVLNHVLARRRGIRIGRIETESDGILTVAYILALLGTAALGRMLVAHSGLLWEAAASAAVTIGLTIAFGAALTRARRDTARLAH